MLPRKMYSFRVFEVLSEDFAGELREMRVKKKKWEGWESMEFTKWY